MKHPKQSISDDGAALAKLVAAQSDPEVLADILPSLTTEVWRSGHRPLPGTKVTASRVADSNWYVAMSLAGACTDPEEFAAILKRERRGSVLFALFSNEHFPADLARELLKKGNFQTAVTYERLLLRSQLHAKQVQRFTDGLAASSRMTVEAVIVGVQTSAEFQAELARRLAGGDTGLMVLTYETLDALAAMPWTRRSPWGVSDMNMNRTAWSIRSLIPVNTVPFGRKLVTYFLAAEKEISFGVITGAPAVDADALRYLRDRTKGLTAVAQYRDETLAGSDERAVRLSNILNARCHDAIEGEHRVIGKRWDSEPLTLIELLFSSDGKMREAVRSACQANARPSWPGFADYHRVIERHLRSGELTGWDGAHTAAYAHSAKLGEWLTAHPPIAEDIIDIVAATPADIDDIFASIHALGSVTEARASIAKSANRDGVATPVPLILRSMAGRFSEEQNSTLMSKYETQDSYAEELAALAATLPETSTELRTRALCASADVFDSWLNGKLWGEPTPQDASNLIDVLSSPTHPRNDLRTDVICKAMLVGGLGTNPDETLATLRSAPVTKEFLRRYEDAAGPEVFAALISTSRHVGAVDWLNVRDRTPADIVALTRTWCANAWLGEADATLLLARSENHPQVLETLVRSGHAELAELALGVPEAAALSTELAIVALQNSTEGAFLQWVTGQFASPELTTENLEAVLRPADADSTAVFPPVSWHNTGAPLSAKRVLHACDELAARGFGAFVTATDGVPRELMAYSLRNPQWELHTAHYAATEMAKLLRLAGPQLTQYVLETVATWEGSFDDLRALILAVRPD